MVEFDPTYHCENCYKDREKISPFIYLPIPTKNQNLPVMVCEYCDGVEMIRLALQNSEDDDA